MACPRTLPLALPGALLALLALAACKSAMPQADKTWAFTCPKPQTVVTYDDGRTLTFTGPDPADPHVCLATSNGAPVRLVFGMIEDNANEGRGHAPGMAPLFPAKAGSNAGYKALVVSPGSGIQYDFDNRWRMVGPEEAVVPAGSEATVVFERVASAPAPSLQIITMRYYLNMETGVLVRRTVTATRGTTLQREFAATAIRLPPPPPPPPPPRGAAGAPRT